MKLFILAPEITEYHTALAFLPTWIREIANNVDEVRIFTLNYDEKTPFNDNVEVFCPPKGNRYIFFFFIQYYILKNVLWSNMIFGLMYPILTIWVSRYAKLFRRPIVMWYAHGAVSDKVRKAHASATRVVTSSAQGFRLKSDKLKIIGQAIDTEKFIPLDKVDKKKKKILYLGRISEVKGLEYMIMAADILVNKEKIKDLKFEIVGDIPSEKDRDYFDSLKELIKKYGLEDYFEFKGKVSYQEIEKYYQSCDVFVNPSNTGSLDKTVLEAMACRKIVVTCNEAYYNIFNSKIRERCYFEPDDYKELARKVKLSIENPDEYLELELRDIVVRNHSLKHWAKELVKVFVEEEK